MRLLIAALLAIGIAACGSYGGGSAPAGGRPSAAPLATAQPQPANATDKPDPSKGDMGDDPYGYGY